MRRRLFLAALAALALTAGAADARQGDGRKVPPDRITLEEFKRLLADKKPVVILDVRGPVESKIKGAKHIPLDELESRLKEIPAGSEVVTYCA